MSLERNSPIQPGGYGILKKIQGMKSVSAEFNEFQGFHTMKEARALENERITHTMIKQVLKLKLRIKNS